MSQIKNLVLLICLLLASPLVLQAQTPNASARPTHDAKGNPLPGGGIMTFEEEVHDFGELEQGGDAFWIFKFTNTGTEEIIIEACKPNAGSNAAKCRNPRVMPGESGEILTWYDSHHIGPFGYKSVAIISNASEPVKIISVKGEILPRPQEPSYLAPAAGVPSVPSEH